APSAAEPLSAAALPAELHAPISAVVYAAVSAAGPASSPRAAAAEQSARGACNHHDSRGQSTRPRDSAAQRTAQAEGAASHRGVLDSDAEESRAAEQAGSQ